MALVSKLIKDFVSTGKPVNYENQQVKPEVKVTIASVYIDKKEEKTNGLLNYTFRADGAKFGLGGFINSNEAIVKVLDMADERKEPVCVRFEKKRKKKIDPTTSILELTKDMNTARENIIKTVVGVFDTRTKKWILTREAESNPENDPEGTLAEIDQLSFDTNGFFDQAPAPSAVGAIPSVDKEQENKENALMSMYFFIAEQEKVNEFQLDPEMRKKCAIVLLRLANQIQEKHFGLTEPSYSAYSHTRARYLIFKWSEVISPLNENAIKNMRDWGSSLIKNGVALWDWCEETTQSL